MKKLILLTTILILSSHLEAQISTDSYMLSVRNKTHRIDSSSNKKLNSYQLEIDSAKILVNKFKNKFHTISCFKNSTTQLEIDFYIKAEKIILIKIVENSSNYPDLASSITEFYFKNEDLYQTRNYFKRPTGLALRPDEDIKSFYGYNEAFDEEFLKKYSNKLYAEIKNCPQQTL